MNRVFASSFYSHPKLHPNLLLGGFQILGWLFFHPSAWHQYVSDFSPKLYADFCLFELSRTHWRDRRLHQLLAIASIVCPFISGFLCSLILWGIGTSNQNIIYGVAFSVASSIIASLVFSSIFSVAIGIASSVLIGIAFSASFGAMNGVMSSVLYGIVGSAIDGLVGSITASIIRQRGSYSATRQIGGIVVGGFVGVAFSILVILVGGLPRADNVLGRWAIDISAVIAFTLIIGRRTDRWIQGFIAAIGFSTIFSLASSIQSRVLAGQLPINIIASFAIGTAYSTQFCVLFTLPYLLAKSIGGPWAGAVSGALSGAGLYLVFLAVVDPAVAIAAPFALMSVLLGLTVNYWRSIVLYPLLAGWNTLLFYLDERRSGTNHTNSLLRWHSAFWDEFQRLPLVGLDEHLVMVIERNSSEGQAAIAALSQGYQRWAVQAAQIEIDARQLERCTEIARIADAHRKLGTTNLEGPASSILRTFSRISQDLNVAQQQESLYNQRLSLSAIADRLDQLLRDVTRSSDRYAVRFRPIVIQWHQAIIAHERELSHLAELRQEIDSPYIIGIPLTQEQEIFVGRTDISVRIEQLLLDRRCPPLLLYGQRRMGKTSLLNNLGRLVRSTIVPLFVDLQGPASRAKDYTGFLYNLARAMIQSAKQQRDLTLPPLSRETLSYDPFTCFDEWLDQVEQALGQNTALLALDEFEALHHALSEGRFSHDDVLGMLRHLIQHRSRFKVLLSGSHSLDELHRWSSYLINVQVIHIGYLKEPEARRLIESPIQDFALKYTPEAAQRVWQLTRGHPFLLQLLCAEIVALKNEQDPHVRLLARLSDVEAAIEPALTSGSFFFADIERNQIDAGGLALLNYLSAQGEGAIVDRATLAQQTSCEFEPSLHQLLQREIIESIDQGYRFQVELVRQWFAHKR